MSEVLKEVHFVYGSGMSGCLFDNGPECAATLDDAIESLLCTFDDEALAEGEEERMREDLKARGIHHFEDRGRAGADYCSVAQEDGPCPDGD